MVSAETLRQSSSTHTNPSTQSEGHRWIQAFSFPMNHSQLPLCYALETYDKCTVLGPSWRTSSLSSSQSTDHQSKYSPLVRAPLPTNPLSPLWLGTASASLLSLTQKLNADHQRQRSSVNISPSGLRGRRDGLRGGSVSPSQSLLTWMREWRRFYKMENTEHNKYKEVAVGRSYFTWRSYLKWMGDARRILTHFQDYYSHYYHHLSSICRIIKRSLSTY